MRAPDLVKQELQKLPQDRGLRLNGDKAWIRCFNKEHAGGNESTPSMIVNLDYSLTRNGHNVNPGFCTCFGCGFKGPWEVIAEEFNLKKIRRNSLYRDTADGVISEEDRAKLFGIDTPTLPIDAMPWPEHMPWRTISGKAMVENGNLIYYDYQAEQPRAIFPIYVDDELKGFVRANTVVEKKNYFNSPGTWTQDFGLYPYDNVKKSFRRNRKKGIPNVLYLVEGPRDAMNLLQFKHASLALLGAGQIWSKSKRNLILALEPDLVVLMFDNDDAGNKAKRRVKADLNEYLNVRAFRFPKRKEKFDASDLSKAQMKAIHKKYIDLVE